MSEANDNSKDGAAVMVTERLQAIRERLARKFAKPVLTPPEMVRPPIQPPPDARAFAAHLAGAIGTVNPRPPGLVNNVAQALKRLVARSLDWVVRPQRDFNQAVLEYLATAAEISSRNTEQLLEASHRNALTLTELHRTTADEVELFCERLEAQLDLVRSSSERRIEQAMADLTERIKQQQWAYDGALARQSTALQDRTYQLLEDVQELTGKAMNQIREEVRLLRQRVAAQARTEGVQPAYGVPAAPTIATAPVAGLDYFQLERHFRGTEDEIRARQSFYLPFFEGRKNVLDIACGRGEFLELMRDDKVTARGVDLDADMTGHCLEKGLSVTQADVFQYLDSIPNGSLDGVFCSQFVEHLESEKYVRLISQCADKLAPGGVFAVETQNPECLAIFSQSFYLDPTHIKPIPPGLLRVLFAEAGMTRITTHYLSTAAAAGLPVIPELDSKQIEPEALKKWNAAVARFNEKFFGGMDYAVIGYRAGDASQPGR